MPQDQLSLSLAGKVAIISGSGKENGVGAAIAYNLACAGAKVAINYVSPSTGARAAKVINKIEAVAGKESVIAVQADISTPEGNHKLVEETLKGLQVDHIDIIVNNAAHVSKSNAMEARPAELDRTFQVNVFGPLYLVQAAMPYMSRGGRIINIGSVCSKIGYWRTPLYAASKAAMDSLTFTMSRELGREGKGITINSILPGVIPTDLLPSGIPEIDETKDYLVSETRAEGRPGTVEEIADAVLLLVSDKSRWITGQCISVSGGITGG